ncbi:MAG: IS1 family transposase [Candidatus Ranarchaeia archaeon]
MSKIVSCPKCMKTDMTIRNGRSRNGSRQMYRCRRCNCRFTEYNEYIRHRFPAWVIEKALSLVYEGLSYRGVVRVFRQVMDVSVSSTTIYRWHKKFGTKKQIILKSY